MLIRKNRVNKFLALIMSAVIVFSTYGSVYAKSNENQTFSPYYYVNEKNQLVEYIETNVGIGSLALSTFSYQDKYKYTWVEFRRTRFTPSQVKELAKTIKRNQGNAEVIAILSVFVPFVGSTLATLAGLISLGGDRVIEAAEKNQSMTIIQEKKEGYWDGYSPRTRHRYVFN